MGVLLGGSVHPGSFNLRVLKAGHLGEDLNRIFISSCLCAKMRFIFIISCPWVWLALIGFLLSPCRMIYLPSGWGEM